MAGALSRCKTGFRANGLEVGVSGLGSRVGVNLLGSTTASLFHASYPPSPSIQLHIIGLGNDGLLLPSNSYTTFITGLTRERKEKLEKEIERDKQWKGQTLGGGTCFITHIIIV